MGLAESYFIAFMWRLDHSNQKFLFPEFCWYIAAGRMDLLLSLSMNHLPKPPLGCTFSGPFILCLCLCVCLCVCVKERERGKGNFRIGKSQPCMQSLRSTKHISVTVVRCMWCQASISWVWQIYTSWWYTQHCLKVVLWWISWHGVKTAQCNVSWI